MSLQTKRVYAPPRPEDGVRILVDRLWPRGLAKEAAAIDDWMRECAPSDRLRKWFKHDPAKWKEFKRRYFSELKNREKLLAPIRAAAGRKRVTLLFAAADPERNNAVALMEYLRLKKTPVSRKKKPAPGYVRRRTHGKRRAGKAAPARRRFSPRPKRRQ
jgi:uncharacterized protein YeaO (DUF488 family)